MIFVTVGTTSFPFFRMNHIVKKILLELTEDDRLIYQHGKTPVDFYDPKLETYPFLSYTKMQMYLRKAKIIISHAGPATIFQALYNNKTPLIIPRLKKYGEHVNDHQLCFYNFMLKKQLVSGLSGKNSFQDLTLKSAANKKVKTNMSATKLISHLNNYL